MYKSLIAICSALLLSGCLATFNREGTHFVLNNRGKLVAQIETKIVKPEDVPPKSKLYNPIWWLQTGGTKSTWTAPIYNNGAPYLPNVHNQFERDLLWWLRNPAGNFVGFVIGFEGQTYKVTGTAPVLKTTTRDEGTTGWKWAVINGWAPFVSYWDGSVEFYLGWRPASGGFGTKFIIHKK